VQRYRTDPVVPNAEADVDGDGLTNVEEVDEYGTDPTLADTDDDGTSDFDEIFEGTDPLVPDSASFRLRKMLKILIPPLAVLIGALGLVWRYKLAKIWKKRRPRLEAFFCDEKATMGNKIPLELVIIGPNEFSIPVKIQWETPPEVKLENTEQTLEVQGEERIQAIAAVLKPGEHRVRARIEGSNPITGIPFYICWCECKILAKEHEMILSVVGHIFYSLKV
ncbi:MAG: hypothetical protein ACE5R6_21850, partial [Candidatus Heimdallarchaeota archaeon]